MLPNGTDILCYLFWCSGGTLQYFDLCFTGRLSLRLGQVANIYTSVAFPLIGNRPQVTDVCQLCLSWFWTHPAVGHTASVVGKPGRKRPLGRPRRRWVDNIRMDLQEVGCGNVDWIGLAQDRERWRKLVNAVMNLRVP